MKETSQKSEICGQNDVIKIAYTIFWARIEIFLQYDTIYWLL